MKPLYINMHMYCYLAISSVHGLYCNTKGLQICNTKGIQNNNKT